MSLFSNTNEFVIANPKLCIGCTTCMAACYKSAQKRGKLPAARLVVERTPNGTMPNQCRQCDNAPCANVCPVGALKIGKNNIELYEEVCIGCKMCTLVCPFGAIRMEAQAMPSVDYTLEPSKDLELESIIGLKTIAIKCDLCHGLKTGPACIKVCPTQALTFMNKENGRTNTVGKKSNQAVAAFVDSVNQEK